MLNTWDVFLTSANTIMTRQWVGTIEGNNRDQAMRRDEPLYEKPDYDLVVQRAPKQKRPEFNPTEALARYRELEGLLNLELINTPKWQALRAQGDTSFLLTSRHFQAQEQLLKEIEENGYGIIDSEDEDENPVYEIEPLEEE